MRRSGFFAAMERQARATERAERAQARAAHRSHQAAVRAWERDRKQHAKEERQEYLENRTETADQQTKDVEERCAQLAALLTLNPIEGSPLREFPRRTETVVARVFRQLQQTYSAKAFDPERGAGKEPQAPERFDYEPRLPARPGFFSRLFGSAQPIYEREVAKAKGAAARRLQEAITAFEASRASWVEAVEVARADHAIKEQKRAAKIAAHNARLEEWAAALAQAEPTAVAEYVTTLLELSVYADDIECDARAVYSPESKALVLELVLPDVSIVPVVREFTYVRAKDEIKEKPRAKGEIATRYRALVASLVLRVLRDLFFGTPADVATIVTLNGMLETVDAATGEDIRPCIVSVRVSREEFARLNLDRVEPVACLGQLGASVSRKPEECAPVRPIIEFDMADRRFVEGADVLDSIDQRPNIMELSPFEFEELVTNLFGKMGLDAKQTRSSRDGGVDCVAFDKRPVLGGKVVIQAKRYRHTVGVAAVRDLFGTMMNEGANKGILVTTAGYGPDAFAFAKDKPIELIDGGNLLYLLSQHGVKARIIMPQDENT